MPRARAGSWSARSALIAASWSATDANGMPRSTAAWASIASALAGTADAIASISGGNIASSESVHASAPSCNASATERALPAVRRGDEDTVDAPRVEQLARGAHAGLTETDDENRGHRKSGP